MVRVCELSGNRCPTTKPTEKTNCMCSLEYIVDDELVEVTPQSVRIRKNPDIKKKVQKNKK